MPIAHNLRKWYLEEGMNIDMIDHQSIHLDKHESNQTNVQSII